MSILSSSSSVVKAVIDHPPHDLRAEDIALAAMGAHDVEVRIERGGICRSDLHYYHDGGFGNVRIKEPMLLGHEIAGTVARSGASVGRVKVGQRVEVNPALPGGACRYCVCFPHVQGGFRKKLPCNEVQGW